MTRTELAARYGAHPSAVARALTRAEEAHARDPNLPRPPEPLNPGARYPVFDPDEFDVWWQGRPRRGRPRQEQP